MYQQPQPQKSNSRYIQQNLLTAMAFSYDGKYCCISTKKNIKLLIFQIKNLQNVDSWLKIQEVHDQTQPISQLDWSKDYKIISGSHDRSVYIYEKKDKHWQKMLVNIDIKLSILCVKWAPNAKKFALGASCNTLALGFFNIQSNCWTVSTRDKLCKSPIITLAFHPSSNILAIGSTDNSIKIVTCNFRSSLEENAPHQGPFGKIITLYDVLFQINNVGGWVNHLSFQENGNYLLVLPHTNHLKLYTISQSNGKIPIKQTDIRWNGLPFLSGYMTNNGTIYAGGFDKRIAQFTKSPQGPVFHKYLQTNEKPSQKIEKGLVQNALQSIQKKGITSNITNQSVHLNPIKIMQAPNRKSVVSYDINGGIHFWMCS